MSKIALDTNAYSALGKGLPIVKNTLVEAETLALPLIVVGELYYGFEKGSRRQENINALNKFLKTEKLEILYADIVTARIFGEISAGLDSIGKPMQQNDVWIAALSKQHGCTVLTADTGFNNIKGLDTIVFDPDYASS